jgi:uncharacterized protein YkwD
MLIASLLLAFVTVVWADPAAVVSAQSGYAPDGEEAAFVDLINGYRADLGLGPLSPSYDLGAAADYHSTDMATNNYFDHYLFDGTDPGTNIRNFGFTGSAYGENIAAGMATAQEVLIAWQNSPGHNAEMTNPAFTEIGVGRAYNENSYYGWYWTADFGGGEAAAPVTELNAAPADGSGDAPVLTQTQMDGNAAASGETTTVQEPPSVVTSDGNSVALPQNAVNADGDRAVSTGANPVADGTGETVIYGDINTGGVQGETVVYEPPSYTVSDGGPAPAPADSAPAPAPVATTTDAAPAPAPAPTQSEKIYTDPTMSESVTTNISMEDGNARPIG